MHSNINLSFGKYNVYRKLRSITLGLGYLVAVAAAVDDRLANHKHGFMSWIILALIVAWVVFTFVAQPFTLLGSIQLSGDKLVSIQTQDQEESLKISKLKFYYRGYKDELNQFGFFIYGKKTRDGFGSVLVVNDRSYLVLITSLEMQHSLEQLFNELSKEGVEVEFQDVRNLRWLSMTFKSNETK